VSSVSERSVSAIAAQGQRATVASPKLANPVPVNPYGEVDPGIDFAGHEPVHSHEHEHPPGLTSPDEASGYLAAYEPPSTDAPEAFLAPGADSPRSYPVTLAGIAASAARALRPDAPGV